MFFQFFLQMFHTLLTQFLRHSQFRLRLFQYALTFHFHFLRHLAHRVRVTFLLKNKKLIKLSDDKDKA